MSGNGHATETAPPGSKLRKHVRLDPDNVRRGLGQLVLAVVELLRQLLERQAIARVRGGSLTPDEIEKLGRSFRALSEEMDALKKHFGLAQEDLNFDLGPLGKLL